MWWTKKKRESDKDRFSQRAKHHRFYSSNSWQRLRLYKLSIDPLCEICLKQNLLVEATIVDHKESLTDNYNKRLDLDNLQSLCKTCHDRKTNEERSRYRERERLDVINERMDELDQF